MFYKLKSVSFADCDSWILNLPNRSNKKKNCQLPSKKYLEKKVLLIVVDFFLFFLAYVQHISYYEMSNGLTKQLDTYFDYDIGTDWLSSFPMLKLILWRKFLLYTIQLFWIFVSKGIHTHTYTHTHTSSNTSLSWKVSDVSESVWQYP